jgi:hypothetical protein
MLSAKDCCSFAVAADAAALVVVTKGLVENGVAAIFFIQCRTMLTPTLVIAVCLS